MKVVFLAPHYPPEMQQYTRGLAEVGVEVYGVGDQPLGSLPPALRHHLSGYLQVPRLFDEDDLVARVLAWIGEAPIDRVLANWEPLVLAAARLREALGLPGMSVDTVRGFRDKELMKERVRAAGLRTPHSRRVTTTAGIREAAEELGFPLIVKPIAGAGSADTFRVDSAADLEAVLPRIRHVTEASVEEYIEGEEYTFDTVSIGGVPAFRNVARYLPKPIIARSVEWISPVVITHRDLTQPKLAPGLALGPAVLNALGMGDGFTHMEWFLTPKGEAVLGEVACRAPGAMLVDQMNYTCDIDLFREWARAVCWGTFEADVTYKYNAGIIFKRALGRGRITRVTGHDAFMRRFGAFVVEDRLLPVGAHRRDWTQTLISDGHILLRHPDWDTTYAMAMAAATDIQLYAE